MGFTEFYLVLLAFYLVLPSFTGFYWVLLGFYRFCSGDAGEATVSFASTRFESFASHLHRSSGRGDLHRRFFAVFAEFSFVFFCLFFFVFYFHRATYSHCRLCNSFFLLGFLLDAGFDWMDLNWEDQPEEPQRICIDANSSSRLFVLREPAREHLRERERERERESRLIDSTGFSWSRRPLVGLFFAPLVLLTLNFTWNFTFA